MKGSIHHQFHVEWHDPQPKIGDSKENYSKNMLAMMTLSSTKSIKLKTCVGREWSVRSEKAWMKNK